MDSYYEWLCGFISDDIYHKDFLYSELLHYLFNKQFTYTINMDGNREDDGVQLRRRFFEQTRQYTDEKRPCSVLEMMVALSIRCEETIMDDPEIGDRTEKWFWDMIANLGLVRQTNTNFELSTVDNTVDRFLNREYDRDGSGGLFTVNRRNLPRAIDLSRVEIWYQMMWYLDELLEG
jgi:hypothetical protein